MIVLGIAYRDGFVRRHAELAQGHLQPCCLVDARGQDHDRVPIEDDLQLQPKLADRLDDDRLLRGMSRHDDLPQLEGRYASATQRGDELLRRRLPENRSVLRLRGS